MEKLKKTVAPKETLAPGRLESGRPRTELRREHFRSTERQPHPEGEFPQKVPAPNSPATSSHHPARTKTADRRPQTDSRTRKKYHDRQLRRSTLYSIDATSKRHPNTSELSGRASWRGRRGKRLRRSGLPRQGRALLGFSRSLTHELGPSGLTVHSVTPGSIDTEIAPSDLAENRKEAMIADIPTRRMGSVHDVADIIAFPARPESSFVTSATHHADGGSHIH
ncbi:SDR family NAD(P)-dependent oxidoreductase [Streptomyces ipomoeae]|uniref:SDR family NAD(P)-dependent oxidoreductase n=1 Tax=Streptomyces ipomoeae TaxID=103232 RepID=UPI0029C9E133|nr:SDR family oxidoreductase [Streptomyces ipomoeae]